MRNLVCAGAAVAVLCLVSSAVQAQDAAQASSSSSSSSSSAAAPEAQPATPPAAPAPAPAAAVVPNGTPIVVEITQAISSQTAKRDDMFDLKLAEPVKLGDAVVIPEGTPGKGQVIDAMRPGMGGKPGKLVLAARYLVVDGKQVPIRGLKLGLTADDNSTQSAMLGAAGGLVGLAVEGGDMIVKPGTKARAKLGADFAPGAAAPAPAAADPAPKPQDAPPVTQTSATQTTTPQTTNP